MSLDNNVYNLFWDFVDLKIWERFRFSEFSYEGFMSFVMGEVDKDGEFSGWINKVWNISHHGEVLSMVDTLNMFKYVSSRNPISLNTITPESLIDRYGMIIARVEADKLGAYIHAKIANFSAPDTTSSTPIKRKRKRDDIDKFTSKKRRRRTDDYDATLIVLLM